MDTSGFSHENLGGVLKSPVDAEAHQRTFKKKKKFWEAKCRVKASFKSLKKCIFSMLEGVTEGMKCREFTAGRRGENCSLTAGHVTSRMDNYSDSNLYILPDFRL